MAYYVNNDVLKQCIETYNLHNLADTLDWIPKYIEKKTREYERGNITKEELDNFINFCARRQQNRAQITKEYDAMTPEQKIKFDENFSNIKAELYTYFNKITVGIANSMGLHTNYSFSRDECHDIIIDTIINLFQYCSRFDTKKGTSAFCYITQMAKNAIKGYRDELITNKTMFITGLDFMDNMESGSNTQDEY